MPRITAGDGTQLYYEAAGTGVPIVFVHEFAGDYRSFWRQVQYFSPSHRCVTFACRGYPPSDVPEDPRAYGQDRAREDVISIMDALDVEQAHIVGHSMGAYTALHVAIRHPERCLSVAAIGCGWGSQPSEREQTRAMCAEIADMFRSMPMHEAAARYARFPMRNTFEAKDPQGFAKFEKALAGHSAIGMTLTMLYLQRERPTLWKMEQELAQIVVPVLVVVGDEDHPCLDGSLFLKRTVSTAALAVISRASHTIPLEEPLALNAALTELFAAVANGSWMSHRKRR